MHIRVSVLAATSIACGNFAQFETAEPLARGSWRVTSSLHAGRFTDRPSKTTTPALGAALGANLGVGHDTDVRLTLYTLGLELGAKHLFYSAPCWRVAAAAAASGIKTPPRLTEAIWGQVRTTLLASYLVSDAWTLTFGPTLSGGLFLPADGGHATGLMLGGFANAAWHWGVRRRWRLVPELSAHRSVAGDVPVDGHAIFVGIGIGREL